MSTWRECEERLLEYEKENVNARGRVWFRGVSNACWKLETTLERRTSQPFSVDEYFQLMSRVKPQIETYTGKTWESPEWHDESKADFGGRFRQNPALPLMTHLRHCGFPSPLLDWSRSPYVAAYFAFAKAEAKHDVAIYVFSELHTPTKSTNASGPKIIRHGGNALTTHERHFRQQSSYTVCVEQENDRWKFVSHQKLLDVNQMGQVYLHKMTVPSCERLEVLRALDRYNFTDYSLFGSEESLMETLAFQEIDLGSDS